MVTHEFLLHRLLHVNLVVSHIACKLEVCFEYFNALLL